MVEKKRLAFRLVYTLNTTSGDTITFMQPLSNIHFSPEDGLRRLLRAQNEFVDIFTHGSLVVEYYKPDKIDKQQPHERDEVYVITSGSGIFNYDGIQAACKSGDLLFVPAGIMHCFEKFSDDFATWVIFYGPRGGEASTPTI